jgi:DNA-binding transcriptional ArsR family regulator
MESTERNVEEGAPVANDTPEVDAHTRQILEVLRDGECRRILGTLARDSRTASELFDGCDVSQSSLYRKLDRLCEAGLVAETGRVGTSGRSASVYRTDVREVRIDIDGRGRVRVETSASEE